MSVSTERIASLPAAARKLLGLIAKEIEHGSLRTKEPGIATLPEVHEACGLDVDAMYVMLNALRDAELIELTGEYPFEEIRMTRAGREWAVWWHADDGSLQSR